jgi:predicted short-subunit dehydrogenase-like oxidoreductase (DUF2520 family)
MGSPVCRIIGPGRAGRSLERALASAGWTVDGVLGRHDDIAGAAAGVDLVVLAVPDDAIAAVARSIRPGRAVVIHLAGSRPLTDLEPHEQRGSLHPLASLPDPVTGARRLVDRCVFAIAGDPIVGRIVSDLGGTAVVVADPQRSLYHATAAVASNHLTVVAAQVERLAALVGVPVEAYWRLAAATLDNIAANGAAASLTGPAARGDWATIAAHLVALPDAERDLYRALARGAAELGGRPWPREFDHQEDAG